MKSDERGDGSTKSAIVVAAIPARNFSVQNGVQAQNEKRRLPEGEVVRSFYFSFSSLAEPCLQRPGAVKGAPFFGRGGSAPLTARTAAKESLRGGKELILNGCMMSITKEGNHDE